MAALIWVGFAVLTGGTISLITYNGLEPDLGVASRVLWAALILAVVAMAPTSTTLRPNRIRVWIGPWTRVIEREDVGHFEWRFSPLVGWQPVIHVVTVEGKALPLFSSASLSDRKRAQRWDQLHQWKTSAGEAVEPVQQVGFPRGMSGALAIGTQVVLSYLFLHAGLPSVAWLIVVMMTGFMLLGVLSWWSGVKGLSVQIRRRMVLAEAAVALATPGDRQLAWERLVAFALGYGVDSFELDPGTGHAIEPGVRQQVELLMNAKADVRGLRPLDDPEAVKAVGTHVAGLNLYRGGAATVGISGGNQLIVALPRRDFYSLETTLNGTPGISDWKKWPIGRPLYKRRLPGLRSEP